MMKQFAVFGCGRFGTSVAKTLYGLGNDVLVIDKNEGVIQGIAEYVTHAIQLDVTDESSIKSLGISNFDVVVIAIGSDIQSSILITLMLKELGVKHVVVKAQNELHAKVLYKIGADKVVFPERDMGVRVAQNLVTSNILDYIELSPDYSVVEITALKEWEGKNLFDINMRSRYGINVMAIKHGKDINISPTSVDLIQKDDILVVIGHNGDLQRLGNKA